MRRIHQLTPACAKASNVLSRSGCNTSYLTRSTVLPHITEGILIELIETGEFM
jgi:hypothetical protein